MKGKNQNGYQRDNLYEERQRLTSDFYSLTGGLDYSNLPREVLETIFSLSSLTRDMSYDTVESLRESNDDLKKRMDKLKSKLGRE